MARSRVADKRGKHSVSPKRPLAPQSPIRGQQPQLSKRLRSSTPAIFPSNDAVLCSVRDRKLKTKRVAVRDEAAFNQQSRASLKQLTSRVGHLILVKALQNLNPAQKQAVKELGFGNLFHLHLNELPARFAYWILARFDPRSCELILDERRTLSVDADDVWLTLGIPKGPVIMSCKKKRLETSLLLEWKARVGKNPTRIRTTDICAVMLQEHEGGIWFKRYFLILMTACLIETTGNGYVNPMLIEYFEDVSVVSKLNWCQYVLDSLIEHSSLWSKARSRPFRGPSLFLMLFYVDRVVLYKRVVDRCFPSMKAWNSNLLKQRERLELKSGGFGHGRIGAKFEPGDDVLESKLQREVGDGPGGSSIFQHRLSGSFSELDEEEGHAKTCHVLAKAKQLADSWQALVSVIQTTPPTLVDRLCGRAVSQDSTDLPGLPLPEKGLSSTTVPSLSPGQDDAEVLWTSTTWLAAVDDVLAAVKTKEDAAKLFDGPSFSIGLTQDAQIVGNAAGTAVPHDATPAKEDLSTAACVPLSSCRRVVGGESALPVSPALPAIMPPMPMTSLPNHPMVLRHEAEKRKPYSLHSPYLIRIVDCSEKLDKIERDIYYWIFHNDGGNDEEILFNDRNMQLRRHEIQSLAPATYIFSVVIDVWCGILNHAEAVRSPQSPLRFFATTYPCCYTIIDRPLPEPADLSRARFFERLDLEISKSNRVNLSEIELFFFPIIDEFHYYVVCFNTKKVQIDIIDNSTKFEEYPLGFVYGDVPFVLRELFADYLLSKNLSECSNALRQVEPLRLLMPWRDPLNTSDCGIYLMRHMETYMGSGLNNWCSGLKKRSEKQMRYLRAKYLKVILTCDANRRGKANVRLADAFLKASCRGCSINVEKLLLAAEPTKLCFED